MFRDARGIGRAGSAPARRGSLLALLAALLAPARAHAQACCAGVSAVTPGRLAMHEDALVAVQWRASSVYGSFAAHGDYLASPSGHREAHLEESAFAALRLASRWQAAALVPIVQTYRSTPRQSEWGGGLGDVNLSARFDPFLAGQARFWPGVGLLAGVTLPSGTPVESAHRPLATDATGIGAFQGTLGVALEQTAGSWLVGVSGLLAKRAPHRALGVTTELATQCTVLASAAYTWSDETAVALVASYAWEGNAAIDQREVASSGRRMPLLSVAASRPIGGGFRLQGAAFAVPPLARIGRNSPAEAGVSLALVRSWI